MSILFTEDGSKLLNEDNSSILLEIEDVSLLIELNLFEGINIGDIGENAVGFVRGHTEAISLTEASLRVFAFGRFISEPISLNGIINIQGGGIIQLSDNIVIGDSFSKIMTFRRSMSDDIIFDESFLKELIFFVFLDDSISFGEEVFNPLALSLDFFDDIELMELFKRRVPPIKFPKFYTSMVQRRSLRDSPYGDRGGGPTVGMQGRGQRSIRRYSPWD